MRLEIKETTVLAVIDKAMQQGPLEYCSSFLQSNDRTAKNLSAVAVNLAQLVTDDEDIENLIMASTAISAAMFMTYEMANAEVEAKELEDLFNA